MRINFVGGPWDGVEFDSPFYPDRISLCDMDPVYEAGGKAGTEVMHMRITEHHQYIADRTESQADEKTASEWSMREREDASAASNNSSNDEIIATVYRYVSIQSPSSE